MALEPGGFLAWLIAGLIAGFLASHFVRGHGFGLLGDILLGGIGAFIGGFVASLLGFGGAAGFWGTIVVAFLGAALLLVILHAVVPTRAREY